MRTRLQATDLVARTVFGLAVVAALVMASCTDYGTEPVSFTPNLSLVGDTAGEAESIRCELRLDGKPDTPVVIVLATRPGTADSGTDFTPILDTVTILGESGPDSARGLLIVSLIEDSLIESTEEFFVNIVSVQNANSADSQVSCSIIDDDGIPKLSIASVQVFDGDTAVFDVTLNKTGLDPVIFTFASTGGTAQTDVDFTSTTGTDTLPIGAVSTTVKVATSGVYLAEQTESFAMTVTVLQGAEAFDVDAVGTIVQPIRYSPHIANLMANRCTAGCHTPATYASRNFYAVNSYDSLMLSGLHRPNVVAGHSEQSRLYLILLNPPPPGFARMPKGSSLGNAQIDTIKQWIDQGAKNN